MIGTRIASLFVFILITYGNLQGYYALSGGISIPANADLKSDIYKVPGNYYCSKDVDAQTLLNCPFKRAFVLKVEYPTGISSMYVRQTFTEYTTNITTVRSYDNYASSWSEEKTVVTNNDLPFYYSLNGVTKIKNLPFGIYNLSSQDIASLTDKPSESLTGRTIIITSGMSTADEKVALIMNSHWNYGGLYFGYIYGSVSEYSWKKVIGNS